MLHEVLWELNSDLVRACLEHPFVKTLGEGILKADVFRDFIAQDAFFLRAFAEVYGLARARSDDPEVVACISGLMNGVEEELKLHQAQSREMGIDLDAVAPNFACRDYTQFLLRTAKQGSLEETVAAITPCVSLYAFLGKELAPKSGPRHPYRDWIETYSSAAFQQLANRLEWALDRVCTDSREVREAYRCALQCELAFFSDAGG